MIYVTFTEALFAGLVSFVSPCVLPIVPFFFCYLVGFSASKVKFQFNFEPTGISQSIQHASVIHPVLATFVFSAGLVIVFVGFGASSTILGKFIRDWFEVLRYAAAGFIILTGLRYWGFLKLFALTRQFESEFNSSTVAGSILIFVLGLAFAFGWTPCVGPVLATILFTATDSDANFQGVCLLVVYGIGMTFPFVLTAVLVVPFHRVLQEFKQSVGTVEKVAGTLLIVFGYLIATNSINEIAFWMIETFPIFTDFG